jgi:hypothetical protein
MQRRNRRAIRNTIREKQNMSIDWTNFRIDELTKGHPDAQVFSRKTVKKKYAENPLQVAKHGRVEVWRGSENFYVTFDVYLKEDDFIGHELSIYSKDDHDYIKEIVKSLMNFM